MEQLLLLSSAWPTPPATTATVPQEYGGKGGTNLGMAVIRGHARKGLGLHNHLQNDRGQQRGPAAMLAYGTDELPLGRRIAEGRWGFAFGSPNPTTGPSTPPTWRTTAVR